MLLVARNCVKGTVPETFDALTSLKLLFMFSNRSLDYSVQAVSTPAPPGPTVTKCRLECDAPHLDGSFELGKGGFEGIMTLYPATRAMSEFLDAVSVSYDRTPGLKRLVPNR